MKSLSGLLQLFLLQLVFGQWTSMTNTLYAKHTYGPMYYNIEGWYYYQNQTSSPFIGCALEAQSVIYLNGTNVTKSNAFLSLSFGSLPQSEAFITLDLYFTGTWSSGAVSLALGSWSTTITYTNPTTMPFIGGFCDFLAFDIQSYSFVLPPNISGYLIITIVAPLGQVGIRNFHTTYLRCHYSCKTCSGPDENQCLTCFSGITVYSGKCSSCPQTAPYINLLSGCQNYCDQSQNRDSNNVCQASNGNFYSADYFYQNTISYYDRVWSQIYDPQHLDGASKENICDNYFYGPFTTTAGTFRSINLPSGRQFPVRIQLSLIILGQLQENSRIQVKLNNQQVGSLIYFNSQYIQDNVIIIYNSFQNLACMNYPSYSELTLLLTIPAAPSGTVLFTVVGQLSQPTLEAWGIRSSLIFMGRCSGYCVSCDETNYCLTCQSTSFTLYQGQCYYRYSCPISIGFVNSSYLCEAYESQPYSKAVFKGFYEFTPFEGMDSLFTLLNQTGINLMKGTNNYTSYSYSKRIFGGPYVWAQAAFQTIFSLPNLHYAASVHFTIIFGSNFTLGNFSYQIESNPVITLGKSNCTLSSNQIGDSNLEYMYQVHELLPTHTANTLNLIVDCYGDSNSVQYAYCGIQDLFIVEHQCQPYCLACTSPSDCTSWNTTYDSSIIKFDGSTCLPNQYYSRLQYKCLDCPSLCPTCKTFEHCTSCISTFTLFNYQCVCQITQYLDSVNPPQCLDCQQPCLTCTSLNYCTDCYSSQVRVPQNGVCECATNYYEEVGNLVCQPCNKYCTECNGPDNGQCMDCIQLTNFILDSNTCRCSDNFYYSQATKVCEACHYSCQMCYDNQYNNCLSCSLAHQRTLVGLKCPCKMGFYEATPVSACSACPAVVDPSLLDCYKLCGDGSSVWFDGICPPVTCVTGFQNQSNQCTPICGDSLVVAGEDCDDANSIQFDGCHNCGFQCSSNCLTCDAATIFPCDDICGDGIISGTEECDDGNFIPYDGCFNCLYQCQLECTNCIKGLCYECSTYGWKVNTIDLTCIENCGDSIVVNREQCDDYNTDPDDGCLNCRYQCRSDCLECDSTGHVCLKCLPGFKPSSYYCNNICGDGKIVSSTFFTEQCDDFNTIDNDGCSSYCQFQCQPTSICLTCNSQEKCQSCATGYLLNLQKNKCEELCGDNLLIGTENCEDLNNRMYDGCYKCRYQCQNECSNCSLGVCIQCKTGYFLNKFNKQCSPICGDKLIVPPEQCDDGNLIFDDGCHYCQFNCQDSCMHCLNGKCFICREGYYLNSISQCKPICGDNLTVPTEECDYSDLDLQENCQNCKLTCSLYCQSCFYGICFECQPEFELDPISNKCFSKNQYSEIIQEHCISTFQNQCIECANSWNLNEIFFMNCQLTCVDQCAFCFKGRCLQCQEGWLFDDIQQICLEIKGGKLLIGNAQEKCQLYSKNCIFCDEFSQCLQCEIGYELNYFTNQCLSICGDLIITHYEECDDGNLIAEDGCHECQFQCQDGCEHCQKGQCLKCKNGWVLNEVDYSCFTVCGDGLVGGLEFCDDGNEEPLDGCYECLYQCQLECLVCEYGKCHLCDSTLELIVATHNCQIFQTCNETNGIYLDQFDNQCKSHCGDSIIALEEECDDGNVVPYDGCEQCQFSCDPLCTDCIQGVCFSCRTGYEVIEQKCRGVCGDGIQLVELEECDDNNLIPRDGCTNCKIDPNYECILIEMGSSTCYTCPKNCQTCDQFECKKCKSSYFMNQGECVRCADTCEECEGTPNNCIRCVFEGCTLCEQKAGYYTNLETKSCYSKCGDNIVSEGEQCDDGNNYSNDGCDSQCQLEGRFQCGDSGCVKIADPEITLDYKNSTTTNNLFFQIQTLIKAEYCQKLKIWIELFNEDEYSITIKEDIKMNSCEFIFLFQKTIDETNLIHVIVPIIFQERRLLEETREIIIKPRKKIYYSESQIAQAQSVVAASDNLRLILKLIGPMTILLGGFNFFWTILDILTWINNFYFINVCYPENVRMFFQQLEWGDLFMIPSFITLNSKDDDYYFEAPPKFVEKEVDPLFANNIQLFVCLVGLSFLAYIVSVFVLNCINKCYKMEIQYKNLAIYDLCKNQTHNRKVRLFNQQKIPILITKLKKECQYFKYHYRAILMQILGLVFLDVCLASFLQITNTSTQDHWIVKTNIIFAWLNFILIGYIFYLYYKVSDSHEKLLENRSFICLFGSLYEGINVKSSISRNYAFVNLIRKCLFIFFTVYYYDDPLLQTSTCCVACFLNIALLCFQNPFKSVQLLIQNGLPDFCIFFIVLITVGMAVDDQINVLASDTKYTIGWVILSFIGISILTQLIFLSRVLYYNLKSRLKMVKELICPKSQE